MDNVRIGSIRAPSNPLKFQASGLKLPSAKDAIFAELLEMEAVRRVAGNSTLYSVSYRRPKMKKDSAVEKSAKKRAPTKKLLKGKQVADADVSSPLIVTVYQSDLRAKKFHVLLKMKVNVRLTTDEHSYRFGVAVAVDEVAECIYVAYTRDEPPVGQRPAPGTRLLLRRVQLTLAAADARGVRRLQRPNLGLRSANLAKRSDGGACGPSPKSCVFEAALYSCKGKDGSTFKANAMTDGSPPVVVQQLAFDGATLLLHSGLDRHTTLLSFVARLKLHTSRATMDVQMLAERPGQYGRLVACGANGRKFLLRHPSDRPRETRQGAPFPKPYSFTVATTVNLLNFGKVADAAISHLLDAVWLEPAALCQRVIGQGKIHFCQLIGTFGRWHIMLCGFDNLILLVSVHGLGSATQVKVIGARLAPFVVPPKGVLWTPMKQIFGTWLLVAMTVPSAHHPSSTKMVVMRASLRSLLPSSTVCAKCDVNLGAKSPGKKQVCKVCKVRGFTKYALAFGCHFCSAACLRNAWPQHSRLHRTPPLKDWTDADWKQWRSENAKQ